MLTLCFHIRLSPPTNQIIVLLPDGIVEMFLLFYFYLCLRHKGILRTVRYTLLDD